MRIVLLLSLLGLSSSLSLQELFTENLQSLDTLFSQQGATVDVLNQYDLLINSQIAQDLSKENSPLLAKAYHKKGIIELSLGKELLSINDFLKSLQLNPQNFGVKRNLIDLILKYGNVEVLNKIKPLFKEDDQEIQHVESKFKEVEDLINKNDLESITNAINISPFDSNLKLKRIEFITGLIQMRKYENQSELKQFFNSLIDDYLNLIKISPILNTNNLNKLIDIYLFGVLEYNGALNLNKKLIHYDMDNIKGKKDSKILNKYNKILNQLSLFNKIFETWDLENKIDDNELIELNEIDIKDISNDLLISKNFLKIRRINENFQTNKEFLNDLSKGFNQYYNLSFNLLDLTILKTELFNSFLKKPINSKEFKSLTQNYLKLDKSLPKFLPILLYQIDLSISKQNFNKAKELLNDCKPNIKQTSFYKSRFEKIQQHEQQQRQQHFHNQQNQQQHQYQQHHQQQQRQRSPPTPPKNDYYKVLDVPKDADLPTIKKAYRAMTKQFHPDKYKGDLSDEEVQDKMTLINHAYEVLSDENLRKNYDLGEDPNDPESKGQAQQQQHYQHHGGNPFGNGGNPFANGQFNFQFGGGNFQFGGMGNKQRRRN